MHSITSQPTRQHQQVAAGRGTAMMEYDLMLASNRNSTSVSSASSASLTKTSATSSNSSSVAATAASAWRVALCPRTNQPYYWNVQTRESRWKKPLELASAEEVESIRAKEMKQREFFECMEQNILRRLEKGGDGGYSNAASNASCIASKEIDQCWMQPAAASVSPTKVNTSNNNSDTNDWIAGWITPSTGTDGGSPSGSLSSIPTLSEFGSFDKCGSNNNNGKSNSFSPISIDDSLDWSHVGSIESESHEERDDKVCPLPGKPSKLERIKSSSSKPVIDKPNLIRTISKLEHDLLARQLNPKLCISVDKIDSFSKEHYCLESPRTVPGTEKKIKRDNEPLSPTTQTCDILSSLYLTQETEGLNVSLDASVGTCFSVPTSPLTPNEDDDTDADATPSQVRAMGSPGGAAVAVSPASASDSAAPPVTKPSLTKRNTCGTIYLGSTLSAPDKEALIKCVCGVFRAHLLQWEPSSGTHAGYSARTNEYDVFRDRRSTGDYRHLDTTSIPSLSAITDYFRSIFLRSQMEVECIIVSLIYIERIIKMTDGKLAPQPANWRSVLFSCMVMASKVWDDLSMWSGDFSKIAPSGVTFSLARTNELEIALLRALNYKVKVNASEYAKYYFLLRSMLCRSGLANDDLTTLEALDVKGALNLLDAAISNGGSASATSGSNRCGEMSVSSSVVKASIKKRSKSFGVVEKSSTARAAGEEERSCDSGAKSSECSSTSTKVSLEQIVRMQ